MILPMTGISQTMRINNNLSVVGISFFKTSKMVMTAANRVHKNNIIPKKAKAGAIMSIVKHFYFLNNRLNLAKDPSLSTFDREV